MATNVLLEYLGRGATAQLVAEVKALLANKADKATTLEGYGITDAYDKQNVEDLVHGLDDAKADKATTLDGYGITDAYCKGYVDGEIQRLDEGKINLTDFNLTIQGLDYDKADKATTLAGYGITDAYTKTEVDEMLESLENDVIDDHNTIGDILDPDIGILVQANAYTDQKIAAATPTKITPAEIIAMFASQY